MMPLLYTPSVDAAEVDRRLACLLVGGEIFDSDLLRRLEKLEERFRVYAVTCPLGLWAPGLALLPELGRMTELYLPMAEIKRAFHRLCTLAFRIPPVSADPFRSANWIDCLAMLNPEFRSANPGALFRLLAADEALRRRFFFAVFLPGRHGGNFNRYPEQTAFVRSWLTRNRLRLGSTVRCLDAACGTGEGTFDLALLLAEEGMSPECTEVHGSTVEPLELFAAAHAFFPNDMERQQAYRRRIQPLIASGTVERIRFRQEDLSRSEPGEVGVYDVILCNGLLGGPSLHDRGEIAHIVRRLVGRMRPGGVLLSADRFHEGWKKYVSSEELGAIFQVSGLTLLSVGDGVGGMKPR